MQTIVNITDTYTDTDNLVFVVSNIKSIQKEIFSTEELEYIKTYHKDHKQSVFSFNRLNHWHFVVFVEKESSAHLSIDNYRTAGAKLLSLINENKLNNIVLVDAENKSSEILAFAEGMALNNYQFLKYKTEKPAKVNSLNTILIFNENINEKDVEFLNISVDATAKCRNMVNEPVAYMNSLRLAKEFEEMGKEAGFKVEVLNKKKIEALKMGGLLAVNKGSVDPPTFSILEYKPDNAVNKKPYVFVGKGVVFDTGGMNIKTANFMNDMKCDMAGAATIGSAVYAIAKAKLPVHVIGLAPATDNRTNGNAYVNGDIITMHDGTTVEVINTDAEGRMLLADALSYAKKYKPELVIDVATLTGSAMRAIGTYGIVGMQAKAGTEFKQLAKSGENVFERVVEFPFWKEYGEELKSDVADIKHLSGVNAGMITAGKFLEHFTDYPYIHLDIAGPAFYEKPYKYFPVGGTGFGVRLLFDFIKNKK
jgi:leucyl aminopeptidase